MPEFRTRESYKRSKQTTHGKSHQGGCNASRPLHGLSEFATQSTEFLLFAAKGAPPIPYVKPKTRRLSPRCSTEVLYKKMAILAEPDTRLLHEDEWGSRREKRTFPSCTSRGGQVRRVCKQLPLIGGPARKDYADRLIERLQEGDDAISYFRHDEAGRSLARRYNLQSSPRDLQIWALRAVALDIKNGRPALLWNSV